jgi:hypothetical protein
MEEFYLINGPVDFQRQFTSALGLGFKGFQNFNVNLMDEFSVENKNKPKYKLKSNQEY